MNFEPCRKITAENSKSFYFASLPLPPAKRNATYATYAFCRVADDIADDAAPGTEAEARQKLAELRRLLDGIENGTTPDHPLWGPFAHSIRQFSIPLVPFRTLLDGIESDLRPRRFETFVELKEYCFQVASTVGIALSHIFGYSDAEAFEYAANMGIAMQLTNILRDVGSDHSLGRIYLPLEELRRFGYSEEKLAAGVVDDAFQSLMCFEIARAREYYRRAFQGIRYLTRDGSHWTAFLMGDVYRGILREIERIEYDVFTHRAFVPWRLKAWSALSSTVRFRGEVLADTEAIVQIPEAL